MTIRRCARTFTRPTPTRRQLKCAHPALTFRARRYRSTENSILFQTGCRITSSCWQQAAGRRQLRRHGGTVSYPYGGVSSMLVTLQTSQKKQTLQHRVSINSCHSVLVVTVSGVMPTVKSTKSTGYEVSVDCVIVVAAE